MSASDSPAIAPASTDRAADAPTSTDATGPSKTSSKSPKPVKLGAMRRMYDWCIKWADTPYGVPMLFAISFAEASFFPIPPDVLLLALCFAAPRKSFRFAAWCLAGSVIGGMFGYYIGYSLWASLHDVFIPHVFSQAAFDKAVKLYNDNAFKVIVAKGFTPIPFKLVTISAGVARIPFGLFVSASIVCRSIRFFLVAGLIWKFGVRIRPFVEKYLTWLMLAALVLLVGGFLVLKLFK
jgi:membrane protein YqaA with SNARE-associated domain